MRGGRHFGRAGQGHAGNVAWMREDPVIHNGAKSRNDVAIMRKTMEILQFLDFAVDVGEFEVSVKGIGFPLPLNQFRPFQKPAVLLADFKYLDKQTFQRFAFD